MPNPNINAMDTCQVDYNTLLPFFQKFDYHQINQLFSDTEQMRISGYYFLELFTLIENCYNKPFSDFYHRLNNSKELDQQERENLYSELVKELEILSKKPTIAQVQHVQYSKEYENFSSNTEINKEKVEFLEKLAQINYEINSITPIIAKAALILLDSEKKISDMKIEINKELDSYSQKLYKQTAADIPRNGINIIGKNNKALRLTSIEDFKKWSGDNLTKQQLEFILSFNNQGAIQGLEFWPLQNHQNKNDQRIITPSSFDPAICIDLSKYPKVEIRSQITWKIAGMEEKVIGCHTTTIDITNLKDNKFLPGVADAIPSMNFAFTAFDAKDYNLLIPQEIRVPQPITPSQHLGSYAQTMINTAVTNEEKEKLKNCLNPVLQQKIDDQIAFAKTANQPKRRLAISILAYPYEYAKKYIASNYTNHSCDIVSQLASNLEKELKVFCENDIKLHYKRFAIACAIENNIPVKGHYFHRFMNWIDKNIYRFSTDDLLYTNDTNDTKLVARIKSQEPQLFNTRPRSTKIENIIDHEVENLASLFPDAVKQGKQIATKALKYFKGTTNPNLSKKITKVKENNKTR